ncbi:MAG: hypothetical protein WCQ87_08845 [Parabacteroides sp.]
MNTDTEYYKVSMNHGYDGVTICLIHEFGGYIFTHVNPPNVLEKLFGISFENKISRAMKKAQARCDKMNMGFRVDTGLKQKEVN